MINVFRPFIIPDIENLQNKLDLWEQYKNVDDSGFIDIENKMMIWLEKNCINDALYAENMIFYFVDKTDLLTFKLAWG